MFRGRLAQYARTFQEIEERKAEAAAQKEKMRAEGLGDARVRVRCYDYLL